ncbi:hypothetical protein ABH991_007096 [Bradyrhizobium ottawaense]
MGSEGMSTSFLTRRVLGSIVRPVIVLGVLLLTAAQAPGQQAFVTLNGNLKTEAWWVIAEFRPFTAEVRGIPANQIRKSWCKATEFRKDLIPKELMFENGTDAMKGAGMSFTIEGRFDGGATKQSPWSACFRSVRVPRAGSCCSSIRRTARSRRSALSTPYARTASSPLSRRTRAASSSFGDAWNATAIPSSNGIERRTGSAGGRRPRSPEPSRSGSRTLRARSRGVGFSP